MAKKGSNYRIHGSVVNRPDSFIDVTISGVDLDGNVYLSPVSDTGEEWSFSMDELRQHRSAGLLADNDTAADNALWKEAVKIEQLRADSAATGEGKGELEAASKALFRAAVAENKHNNE